MISINYYITRVTKQPLTTGIDINSLLDSYYINSLGTSTVMYYIHNSNLSYGYLLRVTDGGYTMVERITEKLIAYINFNNKPSI